MKFVVELTISKRRQKVGLPSPQKAAFGEATIFDAHRLYQATTRRGRFRAPANKLSERCRRPRRRSRIVAPPSGAGDVAADHGDVAASACASGRAGGSSGVRVEIHEVLDPQRRLCLSLVIARGRASFDARSRSLAHERATTTTTTTTTTMAAAAAAATTTAAVDENEASPRFLIRHRSHVRRRRRRRRQQRRQRRRRGCRRSRSLRAYCLIARCALCCARRLLTALFHFDLPLAFVDRTSKCRLHTSEEKIWFQYGDQVSANFKDCECRRNRIVNGFLKSAAAAIVVVCTRKIGTEIKTTIATAFQRCSRFVNHRWAAQKKGFARRARGSSIKSEQAQSNNLQRRRRRLRRQRRRRQRRRSRRSPRSSRAVCHHHAAAAAAAATTMAVDVRNCSRILAAIALECALTSNA